MEEEIVKLKKKNKSLEDELMASIRREEILSGGSGDSLKQKLKRTKLGQAAKNPNTFTGKVLRSPRTVYRIVRHPSVVKDIFGKHPELLVNESKNTKKQEPILEDLYTPIEFIKIADGPRRLNLIIDDPDTKVLKEAINFSNQNDYRLRVITSKEGVLSRKYGEMVKKKELPKSKDISFYSSADQAKKAKVFKLEIGEGDIFLTSPWTKK